MKFSVKMGNYKDRWVIEAGFASSESVESLYFSVSQDAGEKRTRLKLL